MIFPEWPALVSADVKGGHNVLVISQCSSTLRELLDIITKDGVVVHYLPLNLTMGNAGVVLEAQRQMLLRPQFRFQHLICSGGPQRMSDFKEFLRCWKHSQKLAPSAEVTVQLFPLENEVDWVPITHMYAVAAAAAGFRLIRVNGVDVQGTSQGIQSCYDQDDLRALKHRTQSIVNCLGSYDYQSRVYNREYTHFANEVQFLDFQARQSPGDIDVPYSLVRYADGTALFGTFVAIAATDG
ncbi:hypothetical protein DM02DRAFT_648957 [Periconia macrospinosa]|uniref:Uncharacterized protein n=1 Tax=Periconia macrospinosa TaxID=97972 RepID=A0A2V1EAA6_9PLEO|nr:hypothetical protein DM02DRAFT_648957 [Periconia macrospinosa]